jgi:isopenicillin N synthase-like dioxygenase
VSQHIPKDDPRVDQHPFFFGENIFPEGIPTEALKEPCEEYYEKVFNICLTVLEILAKGLPYGDDVFKDFVSIDPICTLRLLHYPPQTSQDERQLGAGAHTDFGLLSLFYHLGVSSDYISPYKNYYFYFYYFY